jgi:hypothetical protein
MDLHDRPASEALMTENNRPAGDAFGAEATPNIDDNLRAGLALLWQAYMYAQDAGAAPWDFALESDRLYETELTISDLRWLVAKGFAEHGQETSVYGDPHRSFRPGTGLNFVPTTCFVLTPKGAEFAGRILAAGNRQPDRHLSSGPGPRSGLDRHGADMTARSIDTCHTAEDQGGRRGQDLE